MLIVALVLAVIGLAALVTAVVTSNEVIAWVCIGASAIGVVLLIVDALRDRSKGGESEEAAAEPTDESVDGTADDIEDYPDEPPVADYSEEPFPAADGPAADEPAADEPAADEASTGAEQPNSDGTEETEDTAKS
ncbi:MAG: DUF308 domain-containing protein [Actinomycetota bacterium]|nr:DUF308 domain-containing protein [Actinomycetota bacterium]